MNGESSGEKKVTKRNKKKQITKTSVSLWELVDQWVVLQLLAIFAFSFAAGILFMHATILYHQYQYGYGHWSRPSETQMSVDTASFLARLMEQVPTGHSDIYEWSQGQLKVNTSYYVR